MIYPLLRRFGHRGAVLNGYAAVAISYGVGILFGYRPTFTSAFNIPVSMYGVVFVAIGLFSLSWLVCGCDRWQYGISVGWSVFWGFLLSSHWTLPYGWAAGISWYGIAAGLFISSAWPDSPHIPRRRRRNREEPGEEDC